MSEETEAKILALLDVISVEVGASRADIGRRETKVDRVDQRLGRLETRVEGVETEVRTFRLEFERRVAPLERPRKS